MILIIRKELEKENAKNSAEISSKEERLIALRNMNVKLESKLSEVMKKWEKIKYFEDASTQIQKKYNDLYEIIANL
jgi:hypothetical protein